MNHQTQFTVSRNTTNMTCFIDNSGDIYSQSYQGNYKIGVSNDRYAEAERLLSEVLQQAEEYKALLVEHKIIVVPPTESEQIANLTELVTQQSQQISELLKALNSTPATTGRAKNVIVSADS